MNNKTFLFQNDWSQQEDSMGKSVCYSRMITWVHFLDWMEEHNQCPPYDFTSTFAVHGMWACCCTHAHKHTHTLLTSCPHTPCIHADAHTMRTHAKQTHTYLCKHTNTIHTHTPCTYNKHTNTQCTYIHYAHRGIHQAHKPNHAHTNTDTPCIQTWCTQTHHAHTNTPPMQRHKI